MQILKLRNESLNDNNFEIINDRFIVCYNFFVPKIHLLIIQKDHMIDTWLMIEQ